MQDCEFRIIGKWLIGVITHQSIGLMLFDMSAAPICHLYGGSGIPVRGGSGDGGDASGPGMV